MKPAGEASGAEAPSEPVSLPGATGETPPTATPAAPAEDPAVAPLPTYVLSLERGWDASQEQALALAAALHASGRHAVRLCCPAGGELARRARQCSPPLDTIPVSSPRHVLSLFRLWRGQRRKTPLVLHSFDAAALQLAWRLLRLRRPGSTALLHSCLSFPGGLENAGEGTVATSGPMPTDAENRAWQAAEGILCANARLRALLVESGLDAGRLAVVHPGCHTAPLTARRARHDGRFVFAAVENLVPGAGLFVLLRAMAALWQRADLPPWEVRVVGAGESVGALLDEARSLGVESRLALLSRQELSEVLPRCDALVVPHRLALGNMAAIMAAWCCELPLVCTDLGPHREIVRAESTALCVPPGDAQALAAAMIRLMGDPALRAALTAGGAGMRAYAGHARAVAQMQARYEQCLGSHGWVLPPVRPQKKASCPQDLLSS